VTDGIVVVTATANVAGAGIAGAWLDAATGSGAAAPGADPAIAATAWATAVAAALAVTVTSCPAVVALCAPGTATGDLCRLAAWRAGTEAGRAAAVAGVTGERIDRWDVAGETIVCGGTSNRLIASRKLATGALPRPAMAGICAAWGGMALGITATAAISAGMGDIQQAPGHALSWQTHLWRVADGVERQRMPGTSCRVNHRRRGRKRENAP
jgi:hypothetical protein